jgi:beta-lactam-binding protein with PASTA domain
MTAVLFARVPAIAAIVVVALLATATLTLAASSNRAAPAQAAPEALEPPSLVVPDVRRQAYVFAKGALEQAGFAWKVSGPVQGYAANIVSSQTPAPGTRVLADGAPTISLQLSRNSSYEQEGLPESESSYKGRPVRFLVAKRKVARAVPPAKPAPAAKPVRKPKLTAKPSTRKPAFLVKGAPAEPSGEMTLLARATKLRAWLEANKSRSPRAVDHWLYQHSWIVTGASFGWSGGAEALRMLIEVDERAQKLWGVGGKSEQVARRTLAEVKARPR